MFRFLGGLLFSVKIKQGADGRNQGYCFFIGRALVAIQQGIELASELLDIGRTRWDVVVLA